MTKLILVIHFFCLGLAGCADSTTPTSVSMPASSIAQLTATQKQLVTTGIRQMLKDSGTTKIISMDAAKAKIPANTNICGYVSYKATNGKPAEHRYFVRLGQENGTEATLMGQIASNPANSAKVKFMCTQAGLG